ncbi:MAG: hypothetical protein O2931_17360, partial [Planctomycetota bacterium]|nr:hypothetical protein [Planctomycetota bacterium]
MTSLFSLTHGATPTTIVVALVMFAGTTAICFTAWRRSGYRRDLGILEAVRLLIVALCAWLLNQPEIVQEFQPTEKPTLAIVWDNSPSMRTRDVEQGSAQDRLWSSRKQAVEPYTKAEAWRALSERFQVVIEPMGADGDRTRSDLHQALESLAEKYSLLRGVVLLSDGDWNQGSPPVEAATQLRMKKIPVFTVASGSPTRLPDLELVSLDPPTFGVAGKAVRVPFVVESSLPREHTVTATLRTSDGESISEEIVLGPMARTSATISWKPSRVGDVTISVELKSHPDETERDNNSLTAPVSIREEQLQVLVVESYPRWEYRYLRNALSRDPGIRLACLLFHPGLDKPGGGNKDYIAAFPPGLEELSKYDVVFLGDVGVDGEQLTAEQCRWLKGVVQHQATGLVFLPGWQGRQHSLLDTELGDIYPVVLDATQPAGWGSRTPGHFELTQSGRRSLLTKLVDTEDENLEVWEELPGFQWYAAVERAKPGTDVLSVHRDTSNEHGRLPMLVTRTYGTGKVLFMGTDGAWRWRKGVEDKYHYRFWGQVVRWMAYQRNMAKGETMRLFFTPDQPQLGQAVALFANVMEPSGEPLSRGEVVARVVSPSGKVETIRFQALGDEWGAFSGKFVTEEPGRHAVTLACTDTAATLETSFYVQGMADERPGKPARPE